MYKAKDYGVSTRADSGLASQSVADH